MRLTRRASPFGRTLEEVLLVNATEEFISRIDAVEFLYGKQEFMPFGLDQYALGDFEAHELCSL